MFLHHHPHPVVVTVSFPIGGAITTIIILHPVCAPLASAAEAVEVGIPVAEEGTAPTSAAFSSCTSSSSSESLRMMMLPSPKNLLANSSSCEVSEMRHSSSEDEERSTTRAFLEESPCSNIGERGWREETSSGDPSGGGDPEGAGGGVGASLAAGLPSLLGE
jgi:hypothetical protein